MAVSLFALDSASVIHDNVYQLKFLACMYQILHGRENFYTCCSEQRGFVPHFHVLRIHILYPGWQERSLLAAGEMEHWSVTLRIKKIHCYLQIACTLCFYTCSRPSVCLRLDQALFLSFDFMENKQNAPMIVFRSEIWQKWRTDWETNSLERALDKNIPRASQMPGGAVFQVQSSQQVLRKF